MNKFAKLFAGMAVISLAASCSSDEPMGGNNNGGFADESTLYMMVNIQDAAESRADDVPSTPLNPADGTYENGDKTEHNVTSARFFFYTEDGVFVNEANVYAVDGTATTPNQNIEFKANTMLVLKGLKEKGMPKYMLTVVNCPSTFEPEMTLAATAKKPVDIKNGENFIMSTSSFFDGGLHKDAETNNALYDDTYPYVNVVNEEHFFTEPKTGSTPANVTNPVVVYVERVASKVSMNVAKKTQAVEVTIAGEENNDNSDAISKTTLYVTIDGFQVTNVEEESYLSKNLDNYLTKGVDFTDKALTVASTVWPWNNPYNFRSFWGMSTQYGKAEPALKHIQFGNASDNTWEVDDKGNSYIPAVYTYETTNTLANVKTGTTAAGRVIDANVPCAIFTATITSDEEGKNGVDLVLYNGVYFLEDQFLKYGLSALNANGELNYYRYKYTDTEVTEDKITNIDNFAQIGVEDVKIDAAGNGTGSVKIVTTIGEDTELWAYNETSEKFEKITDAVKNLNNSLAELTKTTKATAYKGGKSYYTVPIKHLRANTVATTANPYQVNAEGQYGLVRNHWYQIDVNNIMKLGHGVFNPGDGQNKGEEIIPDEPEDDTYGLGATINVLSWRIVRQSVDL